MKGIAAVALLALAGCAAVPQPASAPFDVLGRMLVSGEGRAFSAHVRWRHEALHDEIWLMAPAGTTLAHISADGGGATLTTADGREYRAFSAEDLTRRVLGWPLPLARLQYWVRAEAAPGPAIVTAERDREGRLLRLEQDGWSIRYAHPETAGGTRPRQLDLEHGGQRLRLVIDDWRGIAAP